MQSLAITWLGHSSFRVRTPGGKEILFDPWYRQSDVPRSRATEQG